MRAPAPLPSILAIVRRAAAAIGVTAALAVSPGVSPAALAAQDDRAPLRSLAEMQPLPPARAVSRGAADSGIRPAMLRAEAAALGAVRERWPEVRQLDFETLSRAQLEATRGWRPPADPGDLRVDAVARDAQGRWLVAVAGPRLPARHDIVQRTLTVVVVLDAEASAVEELVATIRTEVFE